MDAISIEVSLSQNKIDRITSIYQAELRYWKEVALKNLDENDANELKDSAPPSLFLTRNARKNAREVNINEIIHYLRLKNSDNENQIRLIQRYSSEHSLERILEEMKVILKYVKETENASLKNDTLFGGWLLNAHSYNKYIKKRIYLNNLINGYIKSAE